MRRLFGAALTCLALLPAPAVAQSAVDLRFGVGADAFVGGDYDNTDLGRGFEAAVLFGGHAKWGLGVEYGEYTISDQPEAVVVGSVGLVGELPVGTGPLYTELRLMWEAHGFDVTTTRFTFNGVTAGAGLGYRRAIAPGFAADAGVTVMYFTAMNGWANDEDMDVDLSTIRAGVRLGLRFTPGGDR